MPDAQPLNYPKPNIAIYECKSQAVCAGFENSQRLMSYFHRLTVHVTSGHTDFASAKRFERAVVFIYSKVGSCHTCCQLQSDYGDFPKV